MNQVALEEKIGLLEQEIRLGGTETEQRLLDLRADVDRTRLEVAAIKNFLCTAFPSFEEQYSQILARTIEEVNPESE